MRLINPNTKDVAMTTLNTILYGSGLYHNPDNPIIDSSSGFSTVVLWALHVSENGDLVYNNTPIVSAGTAAPLAHDMAPHVKELRTAGVEVFWSIGGWGVQDFEHVYALLQTGAGTATLRTNFCALFDAVPVDGFDFDMEEGYGESMAQSVIGLTLLLHAEFDCRITYCPYEQPEFWVECLQEVYGELGAQPVAWFNLQCYAGGAGNHASDWISAIAAATDTGVADPASFVMPGYDMSDGTKGITTAFHDQEVAGGFLWNSAQMAPTSFAQAISTGIDGTG